MKKFFLILSSIIVLLILAMILVPYFYKDNILDLMKKEANKNLEAKVNFSNDIGLTLFSNFPNVTLTVKDIEVVNKDPFEGDTLAQVQQFKTTIDIMSVISGDQMKIRGIHITKPDIHVKVLENGTANYNIMATDTSAATDEKPKGASESGEGGTFQLALNEYSINKGQVVYDDQALGFYTRLKAFNHQGSGDFTLNIFDLDTETAIEQLTVGYGGVHYLEQVNTNLDAELKMNMQKMKFTFKENKLSLNDFVLAFDGFVAMPGKDINMDLTFDAQETGFKNLLSLVPSIYTQDYQSIETKGSLNFEGQVNGTYNEEQYPAYEFLLAVNDGYFQYPDLPKSLKNVNLKLDVNCPDGELDNTVTNLKQMHFEVGNNPFNATMLLKNPISDPFVDAGMQGKVNLGHFKDLMPIGGETQLAGILESDLAVKGAYSSIEQERYEDFQAEGDLRLSNFEYAAPYLNQTVKIEESELSLTPQKADLKKFAMKLGESDLYAQGELNNMLGYALKGKTLEGNLQVNSNYMNLNPMLASKEGEAEASSADKTSEEGGGYEYEAPGIPGNIDFTLKADMMKRLIYDNMDMRNITGSIVIRDQTIKLKDFRMDMYDGSMMASGKYGAQQPERPITDFDLKIEQFGIQQAYETFATLRKYAPVAANAEGKFDANVSFNTPLKKDLTPIYDSLYSEGQLVVDKAVISEHKIFDKVADVLQDDAYRRIVLTDIKPSYIIANGRIRLTEPINFSVKDSRFELTGSMKLDQTLDYNLRADVPAKMIKQKAGQLVNKIAGDQVDIPGGDRLLVDFKITGKAGNPQVKPSFGGTKEGSGSTKDKIKQKAKKELQKRKEEARKAKERAKKRAKERAEKRKKQAKEKAEKKKEEVKEKAKEKKEEVKEEAKDKAEDKVKDIFD